MRCACLIPVRGGSKGIQRKNLAEIADGISLLEWTIRQAKSVLRQDDIFVSTEDEEMFAVAARCGVVAVRRPLDLARDESTTNSVMEHLLTTIDETCYAALAVLQVTSPLRTTHDIKAGLLRMATGEYDSVVSVFEEDQCHPAKMYLLESGVAIPVLPAYEASRRQELPRVFRRNGAIFMVTREFYRETGRLWGGRTGLIEMPRDRSVDIDAPADLVAARKIIRTWIASESP